MNTVQEKWEGFSSGVIHPGASAVQREELRRAFYAGAAVVLDISCSIGDESISQDAGVAILEGLHSELEAHITEIRVQNGGITLPE